MSGVVEDVKMGVCNVEFGGSDLGYTKGFVKVKYSADTVEKTVDQEDAAIDEIVTKQTLEVTVPMAEYNLQRLVSLLPGATFTNGTGGKKKLVLSGDAGTSLKDMAQTLVLKPVGGTTNDWLTLHYAIPKPALEYSYEKENVQVFSITFKALKGVDGKWVTWGDETAA